MTGDVPPSPQPAPGPGGVPAPGPGGGDPGGSAGGPRTSRLAPWWAAARLASRDVRHRPWRTLLVGVLIGLPVAALAASTILAPAVRLSPAEQRVQLYGQADAVAVWQGTSTGRPASSGQGTPGLPVSTLGWATETGTAPVLSDDEAMAALRAAFPDAGSITTFAQGPDAITDEAGHLQQVEVSNAPILDPVFEGRMAIVHGRPPERPGEAAVSDSVLDDAGAHIGDQVDLLLAGSVVVTGTVRSATDHEARVVVSAAPPGEHVGVANYAFVTLPGADDPAAPGAEPVSARALAGAGIDLIPGSDLGYGNHVGVVDFYAVGGVALLGTAIVASAAFAVGARRQLRLLGIVAAAGGSPADLRRSVLLQGTVTGLLSSLAGLAVAIVGTAAVHPILDDLLDNDVPRLTYPVALLALAVALGTLAATAAAWLPARTAGSIPTLSALAGRRPQPPLPAVVPLSGLVAVAAGVATLAVWALGEARPWGVELAAGAAVVLGAAALSPLVVGWAEPLAGRLRRGRRLAARDLARQRLRSGAVVAAIMVPAGLTVLLACSLVTRSARQEESSRADLSSPFRIADNQVLYLREGASAEVAESTVGTIRRIVPDARETPVLAALSTIGPPKTGYDAAVQVEGPGFHRYVIVAEPEGLAAAGAGAASVDALEAGGVVLPASGTARPRVDGPVALLGADATLAAGDVVVDPDLRLPRGDAIALVSRATANRWEANVAEIGSLFVSDRALDSRQIRRLQAIDHTDQDEWLHQYLTQPARITGSSGGILDTPAAPGDGYRDRSLPARLAALGASALLTLAVVAVALALTAAESSDETRLLEAIGSPPSIRRSVSAWQATLLPTVAVVVAVPIALAVAAAVLHETGVPGPDDVVVPWPTVAGLAIGLPLVSGGVTWVGATFTGRRRRDLAAAVVGGD